MKAEEILQNSAKKNMVRWSQKDFQKTQPKLYRTIIEAINQALIIDSVSQSTLTVPDIRNKLSPITHLISMVEREEPNYIKKAIPQAKKSVNYLAQRDVYSR